MADKKAERLDAITRYNSLIAKQVGRAVRPFREDGYVNMLTKYGTQKDTSEHYYFMPEPEYPDELMEMFYEGNGLFAKIIDTPAEEAIKHGFTLDGINDEKIVNFYQGALDELDWEETAMTSIKWARLFGGSIAVMLINDGRGLEEPLDWRNIRSIDDLRVYDRSLIQPDYESMYTYTPDDPFRTRGARLGLPEYYHIYSRYGNFTVHESRCLTFHNGILPENARNTTYQLWGIPEYVRIHREVRDAQVAHANAPKLLDRSVQPIYKMKDLAMELSTEQGEDMLLKRLQALDLARGTMNTIAIDNDGEDYDFKTFQFTGINDVISASCNMLSAVTNIPQAILFGQPIGGLSSTDDTAMENYYNYIERIQKRMIRSNLRYLLSVIFQAGVHTREVDEVPNLKVVFNPLWSISDAEQADLDQKRASVQQTKAQTAQLYVEMQAIDPTEVRKKLADSEEFDVENMLDEYDEENLFGEEIPKELEYLSPEDQEKALKLYGSYGGAHAPAPQDQQQGEAPAGPDMGGQPGAPAGPGAPAQPSDGEASVAVEEHNTDPGTEGSASTAAPAATKLPQDMSEEELQKAAKTPTKVDHGIINTKTQKDTKCASVGVLCLSGNHGEKVLAAKRMSGSGTGLYCGPGGHIENGETAEEAAIRETQEEFGITPKNLKFVGYGPEEPVSGTTPAVYTCTDWEGDPHPVDGEMGDPIWLTAEEIDSLRPALFQPFADGYDLFRSGSEKPIDFKAVHDTISLRDFILQFAAKNEDGAPEGNKNAAGPHNVQKKATHEQIQKYADGLTGVKTKDGKTVEFLRDHVVDRAVQRGVSIKSIKRALEKGKVTYNEKLDRTIYDDGWTKVIFENATNELVSTHSYGMTKHKELRKKNGK